jgi:pilus assembly protein CpaD
MTCASPPLQDRPLGLRRGLVVGLLALGLQTLGGCSNPDRTIVSSIPNDDYRVRHPIVLAQDEHKLDVFVAAHRGLDARSGAQIQEFGTQYRMFGRGPITVLMPVGLQESSPATVAAIRSALATGGAKAPLAVTTYPIADRSLASPIRLSYSAIEAKVPHGCGEWPSDLGSGSTLDEWNNRPYWNLGCASQTALAAQVADPRDLAGPQAEVPADTLMRSRGIESVRKGTDPATDWKIKNSAISSVGTN